MVRHVHKGRHLECVVLSLALALLAGTGTATAEGKYGPGASDTEILIGQTNPYSGPLSSYGTQGRAQTAYYTP